MISLDSLKIKQCVQVRKIFTLPEIDYGSPHVPTAFEFISGTHCSKNIVYSPTPDTCRHVRSKTPTTSTPKASGGSAAKAKARPKEPSSTVLQGLSPNGEPSHRYSSPKMYIPEGSLFHDDSDDLVTALHLVIRHGSDTFLLESHCFIFM